MSDDRKTPPVMLRLTAPSDSKVRIAPNEIAMITPNDGSYHARAKTVLTMNSGQKQAVQETMEEIEKLLGE